MKKIIAKILFLFAGAMLFAQSAEYTAFLTKAKQFETQKKWCHALEAYYDALGTDDEPVLKDEAYKGFTELRDAILEGNPGFGTYDVFTLHDEWKKLLIDAEQVGSSFSRYEITLGELKQGDLDYATRTASYSAEISYEVSDRYKNTVGIVKNGYRKAYKDDWIDLPTTASYINKNWPELSVSYKNDKNYNVSGALVYKDRDGAFCNAFVYCLFDYKFNILDETEKELVKGVRWLLGQSNRVTFTGVNSAVMDLIDNGKAFVNPVACYLEYGAYNYADDNGGRTFIKNFPEVQLPMEKSVFICWNNKSDKIADNVKKVKREFIDFNFVEIPGKQYKMSQTEITQIQYESIMTENPSYHKGEENPVENVSWYDAIYFCNKLSIREGKIPVYSVNGETDVTKWNYIPHDGNSILGEINQNTAANGFRLPTLEEWQYAAKGGESYEYAGSANLDEVCWYCNNSGNKTHPVAQKKPNGYGLYDMSGNVGEWVGDWDSFNDNRYTCGASCYGNASGCEVNRRFTYSASERLKKIGFRIVCTSSSLQ